MWYNVLCFTGLGGRCKGGAMPPGQKPAVGASIGFTGAWVFQKPCRNRFVQYILQSLSYVVLCVYEALVRKHLT
jgi:hypothetical protein